MNKKRSSDIREQLGIFNINDKLTQDKINWMTIDLYFPPFFDLTVVVSVL